MTHFQQRVNERGVLAHYDYEDMIRNDFSVVVKLAFDIVQGCISYHLIWDSERHMIVVWSEDRDSPFTILFYDRFCAAKYAITPKKLKEAKRKYDEYLDFVMDRLEVLNSGILAEF